MINLITVVLALTCLLFVLVIVVKGKKQYGNGYQALNKKEFPFKDLMYIGAYLGYNILKEKHLEIMPKQVEKARQIYGQMSGRREVENKVRLFYIHKLTILVVLVGIASFIGVLTGAQNLLAGTNKKPVEITEMKRPAFFEGDKEIVYQVKAENNNPSDIDNKETDATVKILVPRQEPTKQELKQAVEIAKKNIETLPLDGNESWEKVTHSMKFYRYDKQAGLYLKWYVEDGSVFYSDGKIKSSSQLDEGKDEVIGIAFYYGEEKLDEIEKNIHIMPRMYTDAELRKKAINDAKTGINKQTKYVEKDKIVLPKEDSNNNVQMQWYKYVEGMNQKGENKALLYFIMFILVAIIAYFGYDQELQRMVKERKIEIESEFPVFIDKFVLLLNCGSSIFGALNQSIQSAIASDPEKENNPLYQELTIVCQEIQQGVSDVETIENFGRRVRIPSIMKFSSLISQAIRKGDKEISNSLSGLVNEAWEKKKQLAKEKGAQASTKMMLPLAIMLIAIVIMIMAPAIFQLKV